LCCPAATPAERILPTSLPDVFISFPTASLDAIHQHKFANCGHLAVTFLSAEQPTVAFWISVKTDGFFV